MRGESAAPPIPNCRSLSLLVERSACTLWAADSDSYGGAVTVTVYNRALDEVAGRRFAAAVETATTLGRHPNLVTVHGSGRLPDGRAYVVSDGHERTTAEGLLVTGGVLDVERVLRMSIALAGALETAHRAGVIHGGVSPALVLVSAAGQPVLTEAALSEFGQPAGISAFLDHAIPYHAPPEVLESTDLSPATDVYSLASVVYTLLVGDPPHASHGVVDSTASLLLRILQMPMPTIQRSDVPPGLEDTLRGALAHVPGKRPQQVLELARALQDAQRVAGMDVAEPVILDSTGAAVAAPAPGLAGATGPMGTRRLGLGPDLPGTTGVFGASGAVGASVPGPVAFPGVPDAPGSLTGGLPPGADPGPGLPVTILPAASAGGATPSVAAPGAGAPPGTGADTGSGPGGIWGFGPGAGADTGLDAPGGASPGPSFGLGPDAGGDARVGPVAAGPLGLGPGAGADTGLGAGAGGALGPGPGAGADTGLGAGAGGALGPRPAAGADTGRDARAGLGAGLDPGAGAAALAGGGLGDPFAPPATPQVPPTPSFPLPPPSPIPTAAPTGPQSSAAQPTAAPIAPISPMPPGEGTLPVAGSPSPPFSPTSPFSPVRPGVPDGPFGADRGMPREDGGEADVLPFRRGRGDEIVGRELGDGPTDPSAYPGGPPPGTGYAPGGRELGDGPTDPSAYPGGPPPGTGPRPDDDHLTAAPPSAFGPLAPWATSPGPPDVPDFADGHDSGNGHLPGGVNGLPSRRNGSRRPHEYDEPGTPGGPDAGTPGRGVTGRADPGEFGMPGDLGPGPEHGNGHGNGNGNHDGPAADGDRPWWIMFGASPNAEPAVPPEAVARAGRAAPGTPSGSDAATVAPSPEQRGHQEPPADPAGRRDGQTRGPQISTRPAGQGEKVTALERARRARLEREQADSATGVGKAPADTGRKPSPPTSRPTRPTSPSSPTRPAPASEPSRSGPPALPVIVLVALVVLLGIGGAYLVVTGEDTPGASDQARRPSATAPSTTDTTVNPAGPSNLRAVETNDGGVQLDWDGVEAQYTVTILAAEAPPRELPGGPATALMIPQTLLTSTGGQCFEVAAITTATATPATTATTTGGATGDSAVATAEGGAPSATTAATTATTTAGQPADVPIACVRGAEPDAVRRQ